LFITSLSLLFASSLLQIAGCLHQPPEPAPSAPKPTTADKPKISGPAAAPQRVEQPEKDKLSEKKPSVQKEKKAAVSTEKKPIRKPEQPGEAELDMPAPPPPLRPPTFGGAGG
jgi:hypothetical protein